MGKLFFTLYALIAIAVASFVIGQVTLVDPVLQGPLERYYNELSIGSLTLLDDSLDKNQERWPEQLRQLKKAFGYPLNMRDIDTLALSTERLQRLRNGETLYAKIDNADHLYRRVQGSDMAWEIVLSETQSEHYQRLTSGTFYLLEQFLLRQPKSTWPDVLARLNVQFTFPIVLQPMEGMHLTPTQRGRLSEGLVLSTDAATSAERHHHRMAGTDDVLTIGPFNEPIFLTRFSFILLFIFAILMALAVLGWVRPLWRGLAQLRSTAEAFGRGDFTARTHIAPVQSSDG